MTYHRAAATGGGDTPISGIFDEVFESVDPNSGATIISTHPVLGVKLSDLPTGSPGKGDRVTIRGLTYNVVDNHADGQGGSSLILKKA